MSPLKLFSRQEDPGDDDKSIVDYWREIYQNKLSGLVLPEKKPDINQLIVVCEGVFLNRIIEISRENFPVKSRWENLDESIFSVDRTLNPPYAIYVRDSVEPEEKFANYSAVDLKDKGVPVINLLERLIFGLEHFIRTGKHLDIMCTTLCGHSRSWDDKIPTVHSMPEEVNISWCGPFNTYRRLRAREAVMPLHLV